MTIRVAPEPPAPPTASTARSRSGPGEVRSGPGRPTAAHRSRLSLRVLPEGHFINWQQGRVRQLAGPAWCFLSPPTTWRSGGPGGRDDGHQSLQTSRQEDAVHFPFAYPLTLLARGCSPSRGPRNGDPCSPPGRVEGPPRGCWCPACAPWTCWSRLNSRLPARHRLCRAHGARRAVARGDPGPGRGSRRDSRPGCSCTSCATLGLPPAASGYLIQLTADVNHRTVLPDRSRLTTDLHAWTEACRRAPGWIGLDPTSRACWPGEGHLPALPAPPRRPRQRR